MRFSFFRPRPARPRCESTKTRCETVAEIFSGLWTFLTHPPSDAEFRAFPRMPGKSPRTALLGANEAAPDAELLMVGQNEGRSGSALFEILQPDSFAVPFGDYPVEAYDLKTGRKIPVMQRVDAAAANEMVAALSAGFLGRKGRAPVYIGHPDVPGNETRWPDKTAYGWIKDGAVGADRVIFACNYGTRGRGLVDDAAFMYYSPNFALRRTGETTPEGLPVCRPAALKSMGLLNDSNIPVPPLVAVNEEEGSKPTPAPADAGGQTPKGNEMNPEQLKALFAALGLADGADAAAAIEKAKAVMTEIGALKGERDDAKAKAATAETAAANERKARYGEILNKAVADKRITAAQRPGWEKLFEADFTAANESFGAIPAPAEPGLQSAACKGRRAAAPDAAAAAARFHGHVETNKAQLRVSMAGANEHAVHQAAWQKAQAEHKEDFDLMSKPE